MEKDEEMTGPLSHPAWQDAFVCDIGGEPMKFLPEDFEAGLHDMEEVLLTEDEAAIIDSYYIEGKSIHEIAEQQGRSEQSVREKKKHALLVLREHRQELLKGKEFLDREKELSAEYRKHLDQLSWMREALSFIRGLGDDRDLLIDEESGISEEAKKFYRINGFTYLADVMGADPESLFVSMTNEADDAGVFLAVSGNRLGLSADTELSDLDFKEATLRAFHEAGLWRVGDLLSLSEEEVMRIPGVGMKQIVHLYRRVLFG